MDANGNLHVLYEEYYASNDADGNNDVFSTVNIPLLGWQQPITLSNVISGQSSTRPVVTLDTTGRLHAVWQIIGGSVETKGQYATSFDGGTWSPPVDTTTVTGSDVLATFSFLGDGISPILLAGPESDTNLLWRGDQDGEPTQNVFWSKKAGTDSTWHEPVNVSKHDELLAGTVLFPPAAAINQDQVLQVIWSSRDFLWYAETPLEPISWTVPITLPIGVP